MNFSRDIKHIIWDWNGTLVNDVHLCVSLINSILSRRSLPEISQDTYRDTFDFPVIDYYKRLGFDFEKESFETLSNEFIGGYIDARQTLKLHSGAIEALNFFRQRGLPQCILSATELNALNLTLKEHQIDRYFKTVLGLDHHYADGKVYLGKTWLEQNHISTDQVLFIGDTLHDLNVANEMKIQCLLVATGHHSKDRLKTENTNVLQNLHELIDLFKV
ncbi:MAG: HAD hydrolase-like protein [Verrucomicrobia bacterium]|nr:HAD hydrolase-like protein [Verrucomicrobiota bacterium]